MKTKAWKMEDGGWPTRSVLECGSPPPLSHSTDLVRPAESGRGLPHSKTCRIALAFFLLTSAFCLRAWGQSYSIGWYKIAGGGGSSSGTNGSTVYSVSGTIGQQDAGAAMTGGNYSVTGGFWSLIAVVQTAGAPTLTIAQSGNSVIVSWPSSTNGFTLQQNSNLATTNWTASGYAVSTNGAVESITISSPAGNLFFRLVQ
jgi:hypothetical protein